MAETINKVVAQNLRLPYNFQPRGIALAIDPEEQRIPTPPFTVERREGIAFSERKYFSSAPVPTDVHLELIQKFENAMRDYAKRRSVLGGTVSS